MDPHRENQKPILICVLETQMNGYLHTSCTWEIDQPDSWHSTQSPEQRNDLSMLKIHLRACNLFEATRFISKPTRSVIGFHADWWNSKSITYQVLINCICDDYDDRVILIIVQVLINYIPVTCVSKIKINLWRGFWSIRRRVLALAGHGKMSHHHNLLLTSSSWFIMTTAMMILKRLMIVALMKDRGCQRHGVVVCLPSIGIFSKPLQP